MKTSLLLSFVLLLSISAHAQTTTVAWNAAVDVDASGQGGLRPRIALNGTGSPVVLWGRTAPSANYVAVGNAASFTTPMEVSTVGCVPAVADWMGSSLAAVGNSVWVVMKATPEESKPVYVRRSIDGGMTWGDTIRVDPFDGLVSRFPSIDVVDPDAPLVQYMQFDNGWNGARHVVARMMSGAFMGPVQVSAPYAPGLVCDCCPGQVVVDNDHAVALYRNAGPDVRVMWGAVSFDEGATFPIGAEIDTTGWVLSACPSSGPDGYLAGDSIRYVWMSGANSGTKIYVGNALADDLSLGNQRFVHPGQASGVQQNYPRIAGSGDTLGIVWENYVNGARDIYFSWSVTGVQGLSVPEMVNTDMTGSQRTPDIAFGDGTFHIIWSEAGTAQVRYRKATLLNTTGVVEQMDLVPVGCWPNPARDLLHVDGGTWTRAVLLDAQGKVVESMPVKSATIDLSGIAPGSYSVRLTDRKGRMGLLRMQKERE